MAGRGVVAWWAAGRGPVVGLPSLLAVVVSLPLPCILAVESPQKERYEQTSLVRFMKREPCALRVKACETKD